MPPRKKRMRQSALRPGAPPVAKKRYRWGPCSRETKGRVLRCTAGITRRLRVAKATAANEQCEKCGKPAPYVSGPDMPRWAGQLCHKERGTKRLSTVESTFWGCSDCHDEYDGRNIKPCPKKGNYLLNPLGETNG